jgi:hypothetical protein
VLIDAQHASDITMLNLAEALTVILIIIWSKSNLSTKLATASRSTGTTNVKFNMDRIKE